MKILQVTHSDSPGESFNGYKLMKELNKYDDVECKMLVKKQQHSDTVKIAIQDDILQMKMVAMGSALSSENLISPWVKLIINTKEWMEADIVHYQLMRGFPISVFDMEELFKDKKSVWTIHNEWPYTGGCTYPLECQRWNTGGCKVCNRSDTSLHEKLFFSEKEFESKKNCYQNTTFPIIVSTKYMKNQIENNSILKNHPINIIPFGIEEPDIEQSDVIEFRKKYEIETMKVVIGFRNNNGYIKGCEYIYAALKEVDRDICIISVGGDPIPEEIQNKYECRSLRWLTEKEMQSFYEVCDIFLMPSLAESFGLMALEAMIHSVPVITFKNTAIQEIVNAPECGIACKYKDTEELKCAIQYLVDNEEERKVRGIKSRVFALSNYQISDYVNAHYRVYSHILEKQV